ncbi:uncharacterized protein FPRO_05413 [Fusarium proliferatum ET1]|uniref:Uncharacterized protein n=1 Tax=Fusarium proliferatum (strain ET1) TaxID=1227346 RepID=A0A1L7VIU4_FUSPR|nr:uncharacterized protein FPRO_05413 [Fusarium proliferatum ET1]CZR40513.1 uncharacterized protein FPRO_05413 [Fusarium proliferatum ET1]
MSVPRKRKGLLIGPLGPAALQLTRRSRASSRVGESRGNSLYNYEPIEDSKESLRNSTIPDATGSSEVYGVSLTPTSGLRTANAKRKTGTHVTARNGTYTLAQLDSEIARLESLLRSYELASSLVDKDKDGKPQYPVAARQAGRPMGKPKRKSLTPNKSFRLLKTRRKQTSKLGMSTLKSALNWFDRKETTIKQELDRLKSLRVAKARDDTNNATSVPVLVSATAPAENNGELAGTTLAARGSEMANPVFKSPSDRPLIAQDADPWTNITFSYSASDVSNHSKESEWVGHGRLRREHFFLRPRYQYQPPLTFCGVNIEVAKGVNLSPGPILLQKMIKEQNAADIAICSQFPAYPTSFIVAADTTIKFTGATKHIEEHFDSYSNSGGASVGYGPWSVSSTFHKSANYWMEGVTVNVRYARLAVLPVSVLVEPSYEASVFRKSGRIGDSSCSNELKMSLCGVTKEENKGCSSSGDQSDSQLVVLVILVDSLLDSPLKPPIITTGACLPPGVDCERHIVISAAIGIVISSDTCLDQVKESNVQGAEMLDDVSEGRGKVVHSHAYEVAPWA